MMGHFLKKSVIKGVQGVVIKPGYQILLIYDLLFYVEFTIFFHSI